MAEQIQRQNAAVCRLFGPGVSMQTGLTKCLLRVFTFNLMHSDDTESKHIHTESLQCSSLLAHST